ncbi:uncharacterized protein N7500_010194 [Penicillium coprophilum]|uniref:uncharacterized protein n=1 Tax=Penicillium coprophilum TaxID=36646 RepID=UPI0023A38219|nr:uncharacterized protein N7500_010194 [Penicillium coprophilum]KAJ5154755.1 hypothetical protein N7500_010194 [Penicillium coprophilum]
MDEAHVELPDGHLVNLSPRPALQTPYKAYRAESKPSTELLATPPPRYPQEEIPTGYVVARGASANISEMSKSTKLPLPKTFSESRNHDSSQTSSPTGIPKLIPASHSLGQLGNQPRASSKGHDPYWRKIRDKLEESPLLPRRARSKESDKAESPSSPSSYHRSRLPASTSQHKTISRAGNAPSGIPSPSAVNSSPAQGPRRNTHTTLSEGSESNWRKQGDQWVNMDDTTTTPLKSVITQATTDSSPPSHPSVSPVSAEDSSSTDWEDRFVVNMPTAKDPNPPTMTAQQIAEYQRSIERVHRAGVQMADPETLPSRNASPEIKLIPSEQRTHGPRCIHTYDGANDGHQIPSLSRDQYRSSQQSQQKSQPEQYSQVQPPQPQQPQPTTTSQRHLASHYYSPDEIGYNRISTIWEESPTKTKERRHPHNADGSFLGCREISGEKNPDEILTFASPNDASLHPLPLALVSKNKQQVPKQVRNATDQNAAPSVEETIVLQEERTQNSQNSRPAQCSKPSVVYQNRSPSQNPSPIPRTRSQDSSKENYHPTSNTPERSRDLEDDPGDDNVFISTPTITRTMIPTPDKKASSPKPQGLRRAGGTNHTVTAEAIKAVRAKAQMISTPSGLRPGGTNMNIKLIGRTLTTSQTYPLGSISITPEDRDDGGQTQDHAQDRNRERAAGTPSNTIRGFIRTSGLARSSGLPRSPTDSFATILRNRTESLRTRAESLRSDSGSARRVNQQRSPSPQSISPPKEDLESSRSVQSFQSTKDIPPVSTDKPDSAPKPTITENKPGENQPEENKQSPSRPPAPSKPITKRAALSEGRSSSPKADKPSLLTKSVSTLAKPSKLDKVSKIAKPAPSEKSPSSVAKKTDTSPKKEERVKPLPRLRTSGKVLEIAELDGLQVVSPKDSLQSSITDVSADLGDMRSQDNADCDGQGPNPLALSLLFNILVVAVTQVNKAVRMGTGSPYIKFVVNNTLNMTSHCWRVFKCIYVVVSRYQATGTWPKARNDQAISRFMVELLQAIVYLLILGFAAILIGRTAGYVVLVTSWILWFARPFAWAFQCVGRALIM